ncbi:MAG: hypothetical protein ACTHOB_13835 [Ginsengibacter sp.]
MKQKKLNLKEISNALSRNEMKKIMAGSGDCGTSGMCGGWTGRTCCESLGFYCSLPVSGETYGYCEPVYP